ncbi:UDP-glucosyltransferase 2-like [Macrosteles quadrilineatus]|uniref:UDP-glucosyltransferase 2-like n=1 Tax=Macrosteles quadrilineatus TaxID=74068 RepID=UPI0023E0D278|nr:UDP-glucosyltransferase 2-like [Macrosteles quadrilineatus]
MLNILLLLPFMLMSVGETARILALVPMPMRSHWIVMEPLFQELASRGHQLTVFSPFPQKKPITNYTDVDFSQILPPLTSQFSVDMIKERLPDPWASTYFFYDVHETTCRKVLKLPEFQGLLKAKGQYDLLITEIFGTDCYAYFARLLDIPMVSITTSIAMPWAADRFGLPDNPSYIPNYLVNFSPQMSFGERIHNTLTLSYAKLMHSFVYARESQVWAEESLGMKLPPLGDVVANTSLYLINSFHILSLSRPFPPNVVEIGGIHIRERRPLPQDIQNVVDGAKHGIILMSFGSLLRASTFPKEIILMFMRVFSRIPQTVIFKYEEDLPEAPPNVIIRKWLPQRDLIEHEKVVAFIAHGGLSSTIEAVNFGKPMIGIPFFADQRNNIRAIISKEAGIQLDLDGVTEQTIANTIAEILNNPKYTNNMRLLSMRFRDRPMTALDSAVYWTEYVIRHRGAPQLRPTSADMPLYQYLLLDIVAVILGVIITAVTALRAVCLCLCGRPGKLNEKKTN